MALQYIPSDSDWPFPDRRLASRRKRDRKLAQRELELEIARRICQALFQQIEVGAQVEKALNTALKVIGAESGSVLLADQESKQLVFRYVIGEKAELLLGTAIPWGEGIAGAVFQSGQPAVIADVEQDSRHFPGIDKVTGYKTRDMIALPLKRWGGEPIGVLEVLNKRNGRLGEEDVNILTIISAFAAQAIEQARLFEEAKLAEVVRLLGDIGHDIKNLLTPVVAAAGLLQGEVDSVFGMLPDKELDKARASQALCNEVIGMLQDNARRLQDRVKEIADCVKGRSTPPTFAPCQVAGVVDSVMKILRVLAEEKKITFHTDGLEAVPLILADEGQLFNVFYNLINNAIPEVPPGGSITVRGHAKPGTGVVLLSVSDTGRGMPPEVRNSLFTVHTLTRKSGHTGTGLGTKIVKDVVDAHGGQITVESEEGRGTTFHILLPCRLPEGTMMPGEGCQGRLALEPTK